MLVATYYLQYVHKFWIVPLDENIYVKDCGEIRLAAWWIESSYTLRKKCTHSELFWSTFSRIRTEYGEIQSIFPYLVQTRENTD